MPTSDQHLASAQAYAGYVTLARSALFATLMQTLLVSTFPAIGAATVVIKDDRGGNIGAYWLHFTTLREAGEQVVIDGICSSACTLVLGIVPPDRICVTDNALLGFHAAWRPGILGIKIVNEPATRTLLSFYPNPIRRWIARSGGLGTEMIYLSGRDLMALYKPCR
jgi:hypothetical protein